MPTVLRALALLSLIVVGGCIGLAHQRVNMPPLLVQGVLLDGKGQPIPGQSIVVALSAFYGTQQTFKALRSGKLDAGEYGYKYAVVRTGSQGEFSTRLPGESRYIGYMAPLMNPSEETLKSFILGLRTASGAVLAIVVSGSNVDIRVPIGDEPKFIAPANDFPFKVTAGATRSVVIDVLQLTVSARNEGA